MERPLQILVYELILSYKVEKINGFVNIAAGQIKLIHDRREYAFVDLMNVGVSVRVVVIG